MKNFAVGGNFSTFKNIDNVVGNEGSSRNDYFLTVANNGDFGGRKVFEGLEGLVGFELLNESDDDDDTDGGEEDGGVDGVAEEEVDARGNNEDEEHGFADDVDEFANEARFLIGGKFVKSVAFLELANFFRS